MEKKWIIIGIVGVVLVVFSLSFVFSPSEKMAGEMTERYIENAIEKEMGGAVDIDVDNISFKMETEEGTYESGDNVSLPDNFPSDVYVYEGKILAVFETGDTSTMVSIETDAKPSDVKEMYIEKMKADGWEQTGTMDFGSDASLLGEKGTRALSVIISGNETGGTNIALTVSDSSEDANLTQ